MTGIIYAKFTVDGFSRDLEMLCGSGFMTAIKCKLYILPNPACILRMRMKKRKEKKEKNCA